jgi:hypothetical protein
MEQSQHFCSSCGAASDAGLANPPAGSPPPVSTPGRIARHIRLLGILWLVVSVFRLLPNLAALAFRHGLGFFAPHVPPFLGFGFIPGLRVLFLFSAVLGIAAGAGLLARQPWARLLAIVLGFISLIHVPFGTALGIYTLWVLLPAESEREYRQAAQGV